MSRHLIALTTPRNRSLAKAGIDRAPQGYVCELRQAKRTDEQNRALWGLLRQITKQRPMHNGVQMTDELWKCVFMQALGVEMTMLPTLDGRGYFPVGHRSSQLTKGEFSGLLEIMLAWCAQEGLRIEHFDAPDNSPQHSSARDAGAVNSRPARAA